MSLTVFSARRDSSSTNMLASRWPVSNALIITTVAVDQCISKSTLEPTHQRTISPRPLTSVDA